MGGRTVVEPDGEGVLGGLLGGGDADVARLWTVRRRLCQGARNPIVIEMMILVVAWLLAFSNGANDNFKGLATVWGSGTLTYRTALLLATIATVAGSLTSLTFANGLVQSFSGKGLVPDTVVASHGFMLSVAAGATFTVLIATRLGLPVSTTHALIGGLVGAGLAQSGGTVHWARLSNLFLLPLLASPLIAAALGVLARRLTDRVPAVAECVCIMPSEASMLPEASGAVMQRAAIPQIVAASAATCAPLEVPHKIAVRRFFDRLHVASGMSICFARGINDTPKLVAVMLAAQVAGFRWSVAMAAVLMALGGLILSKRVAETMSRRVTALRHRDGLAANIVTSLLVLFASKFGLPVSTTHVAVGAIAGVGASAGSLNLGTLRDILMSWIATLPLAAVIAFALAHGVSA